ncbi:LysR family transcriptional regulator [Proteiniclasticum sp. SCR006]|uniref:LysR family transcriptional regulator n=1 Tax=Proteiniclasticum aestuarii TaxID=2817862 RepID=A0A939H882_9CLOT|nr:LysR family transcriptional regulator [Proteiniclasticum aestuarii]MBO1264304.1 LysR family transcriptional regulator [Proteiniclasticum aestuarii]
MDIQKLKSFLTLAECRSFSETAELLYLSQPAISKQIESLENELQVPLFNRSRNNISLTLQGEYFMQFAEEMVKLADNSKELLKQLDDLKNGTLFFGATNFIGVYLMPRMLSIYQNSYPNIKLNMTISSSKKLFEKLQKHEIEFGFLSHYVHLDSSQYVTEPFCLDHMVLVVPYEHPLAAQKSCHVSELKKYPFIMKDTHSSLSRFLDDKLHPLDFPNMIIINNQEAIKQAICHNVGISIMSEKSVEVERMAGLVRTLEIQNLNLDREIHIVYHRKKHITPAGKAFLEMIRNDQFQK